MLPGIYIVPWAAVYPSEPWFGDVPGPCARSRLAVSKEKTFGGRLAAEGPDSKLCIARCSLSRGVLPLPSHYTMNPRTSTKVWPIQILCSFI